MKNINQLSAVFLVRVPLFLDRGLGSITSESIFCSIASGAPVDVCPSLSSSTSLEYRSMCILKMKSPSDSGWKVQGIMQYLP